MRVKNVWKTHGLCPSYPDGYIYIDIQRWRLTDDDDDDFRTRENDRECHCWTRSCGLLFAGCWCLELIIGTTSMPKTKKSIVVLGEVSSSERARRTDRERYVLRHQRINVLQINELQREREARLAWKYPSYCQIDQIAQKIQQEEKSRFNVSVENRRRIINK